MNKKRFLAATRSSTREKGEQKTNEILQGTWHVEARTGGVWFCYARLLAEKQESAISGSHHRSDADSLGEEQFGRLREEEEEPVTEERREYTDLGSDLREREACQEEQM